ATEILASNTTIPIIQVDQKGHILSTNNLGIRGSDAIDENEKFLKRKLQKFKTIHAPIILRYNPDDSTQYNKVYYGESTMLRQIKFFPYIQLGVIVLFVIVVL